MITRQWSALFSMEKAEVCRPFAAEGLSGAEMALRISAMYGRVSRNAVIGACNRNGIFLDNPLRGRRTKGPSAKAKNTAQAKASCTGARKTTKNTRKTYPQMESLAAAAGRSGRSSIAAARGPASRLLLTSLGPGPAAGRSGG
ncbi:hypothetical protein IWQ52_004157 [Labrenzia sp. EL_159]|nr:hypothetical protein [Labrenzia sp. EL_162]MBG6196621.1 hypothetical protein [Labrenzia sp. EL_159]